MNTLLTKLIDLIGVGSMIATKKIVKKITSLFLLMLGLHFSMASPMPEKTVVSVIDTDTYYELRATYSEEKSKAVKGALNESILPDTLFSQSVSQYDADIVLDDGTRFHLKISDTKLVIKFSKKSNSAVSYERMKKVFEAAKKALSK
jgi:hypothetical protein